MEMKSLVDKLESITGKDSTAKAERKKIWENILEILEVKHIRSFAIKVSKTIDVDAITVQRWIKGERYPHDGHRSQIRKYLIGTESPADGSVPSVQPSTPSAHLLQLCASLQAVGNHSRVEEGLYMALQRVGKYSTPELAIKAAIMWTLQQQTTES